MLSVEFEFWDYLIRVCLSLPLSVLLAKHGGLISTKQLLLSPYQRDSTENRSKEFMQEESEDFAIDDDDDEEDVQLEDMVERTQAALAEGSLELSHEGVNGTYFLRNKEGEIMAVFKPNDEEVNAANNPRTRTASSSNLQEEMMGRKSVPPGSAAIREVVAYLFDRRQSSKSSLAGVPPTCMFTFTRREFDSLLARRRKTDTGNGSFLTRCPSISKGLFSSYCSHKEGSLQQYIDSDFPSWDVGCRDFPVEQVHAIGILDLMIVNLDRHGGNILVRYKKDLDENKSSPDLIPIDHGYCLPGKLSSH